MMCYYCSIYSSISRIDKKGRIMGFSLMINGIHHNILGSFHNLMKQPLRTTGPGCRFIHSHLYSNFGKQKHSFNFTFIHIHIQVRTYIPYYLINKTCRNKPHYRSQSFQVDMIDNLKNVAIPGTGIP